MMARSALPVFRNGAPLNHTHPPPQMQAAFWSCDNRSVTLADGQCSTSVLRDGSRERIIRLPIVVGDGHGAETSSPIGVNLDCRRTGPAAPRFLTETTGNCGTN